MTLSSEPTHLDLARPDLERTNFATLWFGEGVSVLGNATSAVLLPLLAVQQLGAGPTAMGLLAAAAWLPWLVIGLPAGAWLDAWPPRRVMIIANALAAAAVASVPTALALDRLGLPQLIIVAVLGGTATVFFRGAYTKLLPMIVSPARLESANAKLFGTESAAFVAGPGLAGVINQLAGAAWGLIFDVISFVVSAVCLGRIRLPRAEKIETADPGRLASRIAEGVRFLLRDRYLRVLLIIGGSSNFGLTGYAALLVLYLVRDLGLSSASVGIVLAVGSVGGLLGSLVAGPLSRRLGSGRASAVLMVAGGPAAFLVGAATTGSMAWLCATGLVLVGIAVVAGNVIRGAWRQRYVPPVIMGRVVTSSQVINYGTMPLAGLAAGLLGNALGVRDTMLIMAGVHALASISVLFTAYGRCRELPSRPSGD